MATAAGRGESAGGSGNMNRLKCFLTILPALFLSSCSDEKVRKLEDQVAALSNQVASLSNQVASVSNHAATLSSQAQSLVADQSMLSNKLDLANAAFERMQATQASNTYSLELQRAYQTNLADFISRQGNFLYNQTVSAQNAITSLSVRVESIEQLVNAQSLKQRQAPPAYAPTSDTVPTPPMPVIVVPAGVTSQAIESQIDGDFNGWDGETIIKLTNGQIWQQTEYYYYYSYSFMPHVIVYRASGGYKMKIEGIEKAVRVEQLK
jgi:outer membrane murein-binding lipoprotein Lpp